MLSFWIQHFLSCVDFVLCHFLADLHPLLKKLYHLVVDLIYFPSAFLQICHVVSSQFLL